MSLQVWLPLNGDTHNQGLTQLPTPTVDNFTFSDGGKIGGQSTSGSGKIAWHLTEDFLSNNKWTVATWIKATQTFSSANNIIFCKNTSASNDCQIYFSIVNGTSLVCGVNGPSSSLTTSYTFTVGTWYHVATTYNGSTVALYINGEQKATKTVTTAWPGEKLNMQLRDRSNNTAGTGSGGSAAAAYAFNDFRIYDHALSEKEVKELSKGLVLHYKLDDAYSEATTNLCSQLVQGGQMTLTNNILTHNGTNSDTYWYIKPKEALIGGATYTISCYLSGFALDTDWIQWGIGAQSGDNNAGHWKTYNGYNSFTFTMPAGKDGSTANFILDDSNGGTGRSQIFTISNVQLELKDHATPFVEYGQSRTTGVIYDSSGYGNNGTITGTITIANNSARYNAATYILSGNTDYITTSNTIGNPTDMITMNIWFKSSCTTPGSNYHEIFNHATNSQYFEFAVYKTGYFRQGITINDTRYVINGGTGLLDGNWHMLTATYNGTEIQRYIDGVLVSSMTQTVSGTLNGANGKFLFGHYGPNTSYYAKEAYLSDARIYATALSADDILELYNTSMSIDKNGNIYARELVEL